MTDSLSNLSAGDSGSSLRDASFVPSNDANSNSQDHELSVAHQNPPSISSDELTVISQNANFESQKENVNSLEGRRIDHFELKQFLGGGGMGLVFRAFDSVLSRSVAIKLLPRNGASAESIQRFQVEARSAARLDHPNISRVFQVGSEEACDYIIFEFVEGDNLAQLVRRIGPLPLELGLRYMFQLALAIQHAYQRGVVHRDVKPANVVVTDGGKLKLIDLGLARSPKENEEDQSLTATGVTLGTYDYLSPEQARDSRAADVRSDLYSLGCTAFFMFTGQPPYPLGTPIEKIIRHSSEKRPNPSEYRSDLPVGFNAITSKLLAIDPEDRYQRPAELIADIQEFASRNNIPLLGYDDNVIVKKIIQKPSWMMQLVPVLIPIVLLIGFVLYLDWTDKNKSNSENRNLGSTQGQSNSNIDAGKNKTGSSRSDGSGKNGKLNSSTDKTKSKQAELNNGPPKKNSTTGGTSKENGGRKEPDNRQNENTKNNVVSVGEPSQPGGNELVVTDLEEAFEAINNDPRLNEIQLNQDSILLTEPISVKVNNSLTISSSAENPGIIVFRPDSETKAGLFKIRGGNIDFKNVHLRLETSSVMAGTESPQSYQATLLELEGVSNMTFTGGSLTIDNFDDDGEKILSRCKFISLARARTNGAMFEIEPRESSTKKPAITLMNCCLRGEADLIYMAESFPLAIALTNGLFVSDGRMFELGPPEVSSVTSNSEIEIYVSHFTSIASLGFAQFDAGLQAEFLPVRIEATQSIFNYGSQTSFIQHQNLASDFQKNKSFVFKTKDSFFRQKNPLWTIGYRDGTDTEVFDFSAMGDWLNVTGIAGDTSDVTWQNFEGLSIPPNEHTVFDYELSGGWAGNPAVRQKSGLAPKEFSPIPPAFIE